MAFLAVLATSLINRCSQARRQGRFEGFAQTPLVASKGFFIHRLTAHFKCPTVGNWSTSSLAAIENHRKNKSGCSCACLFIVDQRRAHT